MLWTRLRTWSSVFYAAALIAFASYMVYVDGKKTKPVPCICQE